MGEETRKRQKTSDTPLASRTHTKEVHQRRRRHKRTNSLSSISQLSSQVVLPAAKRLEFGAAGRQDDEELVEPAKTKATTERAGVAVRSPPTTTTTTTTTTTRRGLATSTHARQADADGLSQNGDNADGPYAAGANTGKRPVPVDGGHNKTTPEQAAGVAKRARQTEVKSTPPARHHQAAQQGQEHAEGQHFARAATEQGKASQIDTAAEQEREEREHEEAGGEQRAAAAAIITSVAPPDHHETEEYAYADAYDPYEYIRQLPPRAALVQPQRILLPPLKRRKPTLVLDLDETLVHSTIEPPPPGSPSPDHVFSVTLENTTYNVFVRVRPNMHQFLAEVAKLFELVVFTASQEAYAGRLLDMLDTERHISHRLYRDACVFVDGNFVKDLDMLGRDLQRTTIVDNSPLAFAYHLDNGIPIESWFGERSDNHLLALVPFLRELARADDVRPLIRKKYAVPQHRFF